MHQMGSHGPAYYKRSAPAQKRFLPECTNTALGQCDHEQLVNAYDNTIVATDHFLAATIAWLQGQAGEFAPALLYVSDHGESLGELGIFLHGLPYTFAPEVQKQVPLIAWLTPALASRRSLDVACVRASLATPLSHDNVFHSVLGLLDVTTPTYRAGLDAFAACRKAKAT
jgi:lipid A ethanolaminephosphotransferase